MPNATLILQAKLPKMPQEDTPVKDYELASPIPSNNPFTVTNGSEYHLIIAMQDFTIGSGVRVIIQRKNGTEQIFDETRTVKRPVELFAISRRKNLEFKEEYKIFAAGGMIKKEWAFTVYDHTFKPEQQGAQPGLELEDIGKQTVDILTGVGTTIAGVATPYAPYIAAGAIIVGAIVLLPLVLRSAGSSITKSITGD